MWVSALSSITRPAREAGKRSALVRKLTARIDIVSTNRQVRRVLASALRHAANRLDDALPMPLAVAVPFEPHEPQTIPPREKTHTYAPRSTAGFGRRPHESCGEKGDHQECASLFTLNAADDASARRLEDVIIRPGHTECERRAAVTVLRRAAKKRSRAAELALHRSRAVVERRVSFDGRAADRQLMVLLEN